MTYTYTWTDAEQTSLLREDADGNVAFVPVAEWQPRLRQVSILQRNRRCLCRATCCC